MLLEIQPDRQKTRPDFAITEQKWGVRAIDTTAVVKDGSRLFYQRDGRLTPIRRIYNRVIPDELLSKGVTLPFDYRDDLDVEWTGHPEWYFRISKFSIPWLRHPSVPRTWFLHEVDRLPDARERLLLKPLFSFAGGGIVFAPTDEQLAAIPRADRNQVHPAGAHLVRAGHRDTAWRDAGRDPDDVHLDRSAAGRAAALTDGPRQDDGRRSQQRPALGRCLGRVGGRDNRAWMAFKWYCNGMRTTIDKAGRVVVPAAIRERAGLTPGTALEITVDEFGVRLERVAPGPRLVRVGRRMVARPTAATDDRPAIDIAAIIDEERSRWP